MYGADVRILAPDLRAGLLRELGIEDPDADRQHVVAPVPFWLAVIDGLAWASDLAARS